MRVIIYDFEKGTDSQEKYTRRLVNGETLLERQFRILQDLGVYEIEVAGSRALYKYACECVAARRDMHRIAITAFNEKITFVKTERILMIESGLLFCQNVLKDMYESEEKCQILAEFRKQEGYQDLAVRLDMDWIVETGNTIEGLDCCPVYPLMTIDFSAFEEMEPEELQQALQYDGNETFLCSMIEAVAAKTKGILLFEESGRMQRANGLEKTALSGQMLDDDLLMRPVIKGCGASVQIQRILEKDAVRNMLLVHDEMYSRMPLKMLFEKQGIVCEGVFFESQEKLKQVLLDKMPTLIIAVGDSRLLREADAVRKALFAEQGLYPELKMMAIPSALSWDYDVVADYYVLDGALACVCKNEVPDTFLYAMLYRTYALLLRRGICPDEIDKLKVVFQHISRAKAGFEQGKPAAYQRVLEACFILSEKGFAVNLQMEDWATQAAKQLDCETEQLEAFLIPELVKTFYEKTKKLSEAFWDEKLQKSIGDAVGVHAEEKGQLEERKRYVQILVENGIKIIKPTTDVQKISDTILENCAKDALPIALTKKELTGILKKSIQFAEQVAEEIAVCAETGEEIVFTKPKAEISLKNKIIKNLKKIKIVKKLNMLIRKKGMFKLYQFVYPVNKKWVLFEAYGGIDNGYSCNTRAIYEAMLQDPDYFDYKFIWAFIHPGKFRFLKRNPNTVTVKRGSRRYLKFCARAGYIFTNTGMPKYIKPNRHQEMVYTWHGKPLKRIGCSFKGESEGKRSKKELFRDYTASGRRLSKLLSPAPIFTDIMADAYNLSPSKRKTAMLETGYPRNDYLFRYTKEDVLAMKLKLQIPLDKKVVLYAPTWRPFKWIGGKKFEHTAVLDLEKLKEQFGDEYVFLCRLHHLERDSMQFDQYPDFLYDVSRVQDVNDLYIISDCLISDYSGTVFDFANLKRPIVLFMYDKDQYVGDANGLNFDLEFLPGPIVETQEEMVEAVKDQIEHFVYEGKYQRFNEACNCLDGADCAIRTAKQIVEVNPEATRKQNIQIKLKIIFRNTKLTLQGWSRKLPFLWDENTRKIVSYHNKYRGQRCFLIGNGPSLRLSDLNMLKDEYCFGCNMIYKVFERTEWRPTFLCASDRVVAQAASEQLQDCPESMLWVSKTAYDLMPFKGDNLICVNNLRKEKYYVHGNMTEYYVPSIATVMTFMIELAMYMGFSEIYLLGVDFSIGRNQNDHFMNSYRDNNMTQLERIKMRNMFRGEDIGIHEAQVRLEGRALYAYQKLEEYAKKKGYHIYNATRGGYLEVFERANLDVVVKSNKTI